MNRLDRYYIPAGVPARPPRPMAPPLPKKGILLMPPPPPSKCSADPAATIMAMPASAQDNFVGLQPMAARAPQVGEMRFPPPPAAVVVTSAAGRPQNNVIITRPAMARGSMPISPNSSTMGFDPGLGTFDKVLVPTSANPIATGMPFPHALDLESRNLASALSLPHPEASPRLALQRLLMLHEKGEHREAAAFMRKLPFQTFRQLLPQLPSDVFIEAMPHSLPILEALYAKIFLSPRESSKQKQKMLLLGNAQNLRPEAVVWQLVKFFAKQEDGLSQSPTGQTRWEFCGPFISSCKRLLNVLLSAEPRLKRIVQDRKKALMKAIEGLGQHGMVGTSDEQLMSLHDALKLEFEKSQKAYLEGLQQLEALSLLQHTKNGKGTINGKAKVAPIAQSHQRQLSLKSSEIQKRLIKNKTLLNVVEPTLENTPLEVLLGILQKRIELDKECLFQYTQIKKDGGAQGNASQGNTSSNSRGRRRSGSVSGTSSTSGRRSSSADTGHNADESVAPILMKYQRGCQQVLELIREVSEDEDRPGCGGGDASSSPGLDDEDANLSDISGYHSDSESCVMTSGNSPFISKEARYSFLSRSVRLGSKHNVRASILASSLCLDTASLRSGPASIKGSISGISTGKRSTVARAESKSNAESGHHHHHHHHHHHLHSSSGVSSGSASFSSENPVPSVALSTDSSSTVVKQEAKAAALKLKLKPPTVPTVSGRPSARQLMGKQKAAGVGGGGGHYESDLTKPGGFSTCQKCGNGSSTSSDDNEPIYQGIIERDISVLRREAEMDSLKEDVSKLQTELSLAQKTIFSLEDSESELKSQLATEKHRTLTLERLVSSSSSPPSCNLDVRPVTLVQRYGELYSQLRLETLNGLDQLPELVNSEELKNKLLFSVVVLAFRSVTTSIASKRDQIRRILQLPPPQPGNGSPLELDPAVKAMEDAVTAYLRRATEKFDLSKNVEEVCSQIWATLYDYPCLKNCDGIVKYVKECTRTAWGLVNQVPSYSIEYETRQFRSDLHVRFHSADAGSSLIQTYLWPALLEGREGPCVHKGVVMT